MSANNTTNILLVNVEFDRLDKRRVFQHITARPMRTTHVVVNDLVLLGGFHDFENVLNSTIDFSTNTSQNDDVLGVLVSSFRADFDRKSGVFANNTVQSNKQNRALRRGDGLRIQRCPTCSKNSFMPTLVNRYFLGLDIGNIASNFNQLLFSIIKTFLLFLQRNCSRGHRITNQNDFR